MRKIKLWTRQHKNILEDLSKNNSYKVKERYIRKKFDSIAQFHIDIYKWYRYKASDIVEPPEDVLYPIWCSTKTDLKLPLAGNHVMLELSVPEDEVILLDMLKWDYVVNHWYIPENKEDKRKYKKQLQRYGIKSESSIYMENFYPRLKKKMKKSWDRLFDKSVKLSDKKVATIWEIRNEWIDNIEHS